MMWYMSCKRDPGYTDMENNVMVIAIIIIIESNLIFNSTDYFESYNIKHEDWSAIVVLF